MDTQGSQVVLKSTKYLANNRHDRYDIAMLENIL